MNTSPAPRTGPWFRTAADKTGALTGNAPWPQDATCRGLHLKPDVLAIEGFFGSNYLRVTDRPIHGNSVGTCPRCGFPACCYSG